MTLVARTEADGMALAYWTLGSDAGCGNNRVKVSGEGFARELVFCASAAPGPAAQINIGSGNSQLGEAGTPLAEALLGSNGIAGVQVTFRVVQGSGKVASPDHVGPQVTVPPGRTGHALAIFLLGAEAGNQRVEANFATNLAGPASR